MGEIKNTPSLEDVSDLILDGYVPFAEIERAVPWPTDPENYDENDAEHSWSLAFVACAVARELELDIGKTAQMAILHDFVERFAGDTSVWDEAGSATKAEREAQALEVIKERYARFPWIWEMIEEYKECATMEACLVYALDKLMPLIMIEAGDGYFWKNKGITYADHMRKVSEVRPKIAKHPVVLAWYEEMLKKVEDRCEKLFAPESSEEDHA